MRQSKLSNQLRRDRIDEELAMTPDERVRRALQLGEDAVRTMQTSLGISRAEAKRRIHEQHQLGRRPSKANAW